MSQSSPNYITPAGLETLKQEYSLLLNEERPKLVEVVAWAAGNGDRSENGDYIYGKKKLREIDRRIRFLTKRIENAEVVDPAKIDNEKVVFGATVEFEDEQGNTDQWQIVGEDESDPQNGKVSWRSPLARSLMGKSIGDECKITRPKGNIWITIIDIRYI